MSKRETKDIVSAEELRTLLGEDISTKEEKCFVIHPLKEKKYKSFRLYRRKKDIVNPKVLRTLQSVSFMKSFSEFNSAITTLVMMVINIILMGLVFILFMIFPNPISFIILIIVELLLLGRLLKS